MNHRTFITAALIALAATLSACDSRQSLEAAQAEAKTAREDASRSIKNLADVNGRLARTEAALAAEKQEKGMLVEKLAAETKARKRAEGNAYVAQQRSIGAQKTAKVAVGAAHAKGVADGKKLAKVGKPGQGKPKG